MPRRRGEELADPLDPQVHLVGDQTDVGVLRGQDGQTGAGPGRGDEQVGVLHLHHGLAHVAAAEVAAGAPGQALEGGGHRGKVLGVLLDQFAGAADELSNGALIVNPNDTDARATIELYNSDATLALSKVEKIPAGHRKAQLLSELIPDSVGQDRKTGYIRIKADKPVASFAIFGTNDLQAL